MDTFRAQYAYPILTEIPLTMTYPASGPLEGYTVLHATGCSHSHRKSFRPAKPFAGDEHYYSGDYFEVAPCARSSNVRMKPRDF